MEPTEQSRIWVDPVTGCWFWQAGMTGQGYGVATFRGQTVAAHRLTYEIFIGPIPPGLELGHLCHIADLGCPGGIQCVHRRCVNPMHLEPVTHSESMLRKYRRSPSHNRRKTHCPKGHEYTPENTLQRGGKHPGRVCRTCHRVWNSDYQKRTKRRVFAAKRCVICGEEFVPKQERKVLCRKERCKRLHAQLKKAGEPLPFGG